MATLPLHYAFGANEKVGNGVIRILDEIASCGESVSRDSRAPLDELVHEERLLIKRLRALLWFAHPALSAAEYLRVKIKLRKAAGLLSEHRDLSVTRSTLEKLAQEQELPPDQNILKQVSKSLAGDEPTGEKAKKVLRESLRQATGIVRESVGEIKRGATARFNWPDPADRVKKALHTARRAGKEARESGKDVDYHTWRKKAKRLLYQLELTQVDPGHRSKRIIKKVAQLQDRLGSYHDIVVAEERLRHQGKRPTATSHALRLLHERKAQLRKKARQIKKRLDVSI